MYRELSNNMEKEIWKTIEEFDNYEVSNFGNVRNKKTGRLLKKAIKKRKINSLGYEYVTVKGRYKLYVHRLVAKAFVENPNPTKFNIIDHIDTNSLNNHYLNLKWTDYKGNMNNPRTKEKLRERGIGKFIELMIDNYGELEVSKLEYLWKHCLHTTDYKLIDPHDSNYSIKSYNINNKEVNVWVRNKKFYKYRLTDDHNIKFRSAKEAYDYCVEKGLTNRTFSGFYVIKRHGLIEKI